MKTFETSFNDGQSSLTFEVKVSLGQQGLTFESVDAARPLSVQWAYSDIRVIEPPHRDFPAKLCAKTMPEARLWVEATDYHFIKKHLKHKQIHSSFIAHSWKTIGLFSVFILFLIAAALLGVPYFSHSITPWVPTQWDKALGQWAQNTVLEGKRLCVAPKGEKVLTKLVTKLSEAQGVPLDQFQVRIVDSPEMNALTFPGDRIIIYSGLLNKLEDPDSLAGVLGHEMGHAVYRHSTENIIRYLSFTTILNGLFGTHAGQASTLINLKYSRDAETNADAFAVDLMNKANISPKGLAELFQLFEISENKNKNQDFKDLLQYLQTHPLSEQRKENVLSAEGHQKLKPSLTTTEWQDLKSICEKIIIYRKQDQSSD